MFRYLFDTDFLIPSLYLFISILTGIFIEFILLNLLKKTFKKNRNFFYEVIFKSFKGISLAGFFLIGLYLALYLSKINPKYFNIANKIIISLIVANLTFFLSRLSKNIFNFYSSDERMTLPSVSITINIIKISIFLIGMLIILQINGISITPMLTAIGISGLAVALALQDTLSNFFAGIYLVISKQVFVGNYIKLDSGEEGYVTDIKSRYTTLRELPNNRIIIPNSKLSSAIVKNFHLPEKEMSVPVDIGVSYDSDLQLVERVTIETAKEVMAEIRGGKKEFLPYLRYHTFNDFSIDFTVYLRVNEYVDQYLVKHEFIKKLHSRYKEEKIEIPFPIRNVYLKKGDEQY